MENLGDIDRQTIAGAISTGTHGTGARLRNISAQVEGLELVLGRRQRPPAQRRDAPRAAAGGAGRGRGAGRDLGGDPALRPGLHPAAGRRAAPARGGARHLRRAGRRRTTTSSSSPSPTPTRPWSWSATGPRTPAKPRGRAAAYLNDVVLENWALGALSADRQGAARGDPGALPARRPARLRQPHQRPQRPRLRQRAPGPLHRDGVRGAARARPGGGAAGDRVGALEPLPGLLPDRDAGRRRRRRPASAPRTSATPPTSPSTSTGGWSGAPTSRRSRRSWTTTAAAPTGASATSRPPRPWRRATRPGPSSSAPATTSTPDRVFANEYTDRVLGPTRVPRPA